MVLTAIGLGILENIERHTSFFHPSLLCMSREYQNLLPPRLHTLSLPSLRALSVGNYEIQFHLSLEYFHNLRFQGGDQTLAWFDYCEILRAMCTIEDFENLAFEVVLKNVFD